MITRGTRPSAKAIPYDDDMNPERHRLPIVLYLAGTAVVMNVLAALLSLMALSLS